MGRSLNNKIASSSSQLMFFSRHAGRPGQGLLEVMIIPPRLWWRFTRTSVYPTESTWENGVRGKRERERVLKDTRN